MDDSHWPVIDDAFRIARAFLITVVATALVFALANRLFLPIAEQLSTLRSGRTGIAYRPITSGSSTEIALCLIFGTVALSTKKTWPVLLCGIILVIFVPVYAQAFAWSGPGYLLWTAKPMFHLRSNLIQYAALFDVVILTFLGGHFRMRMLSRKPPAQSPPVEGRLGRRPN